MRFPSVSHTTHRLALLGLSLGLLVVTGCANDPVGDEGSVSEASREAAIEKTADVLRTDQSLNTVQLVQDLTGGFAQGVADEAGGLDMELGGDLPEGVNGEYGVGARLAAAQATAAEVADRLRDLELSRSKTGATDPQPGDLLFRLVDTHLDGSVTVLSVYQGEPLSVVRLTKETTWPQGNPLLKRIFEEATIDRGEDLVRAFDDVWLSYAGELEFTAGQRLQRSIDAHEQGGLRDDVRVDVVSTFLPRPDHPSLVDIQTILTVDLHTLARPADDRFVRVTRVSRFTGEAHDGGQPRVEEEFEPESPIAEGEEPCGGHLARTISFRQRSALVRWADRADWSCAGGGSLGRTIDYAGGSHASLTLTEDADGVVTLEQADREGNQTTGRFDKNAGTFELTTQYRPGSDPASRSIEGQSTSDGRIWSLDERVTFRDGFVETNHLEGEENADGKQLSGVHDGRDGHVEFELGATPDETVLTGHVENDRDEVLDFRVEMLPDGSRLLDFTASDPARRVEGHLTVDADGCGEGTILVEENGNRAEIHVTFCHGEIEQEIPALSSGF